jgi:uncharacterized membrane protein
LLFHPLLLQRSIRVALAICVTAVIGMATDKSFPFLAPATVGVLFGGYQGATFRTALNRFLVRKMSCQRLIAAVAQGSIQAVHI